MKFIRLFALLFSVLALNVNAETSFSDFVNGKEHHQGYFDFYVDNTTGQVYLAIDNFDQEFLFQSSLPKGVGSNDIGLDRGQLGDTRIVKFERVGDKVFLRQVNTYYRANSTNDLERQAIEEAFASSVIWGFKVAQAGEGVVLIDYTPFLISDIHQVANRLSQTKQGSFKADKTRSGFYAKRSKAFPKNTELEATVTFVGKGTGEYIRSVSPEPNAVSVNMHHSLIELPDDGYKPRDFHPYSGFWSVAHADYASAIEEDMIKRVIPRHRLAKQNPNAEYSEAVEPIVYYLDAGVPEPIKSALIDGAMWWDQAFAAAGYKNAFQVKMLPPEADPMDVRYNVIQWVHRATRGWSYGASVIDPRTGEILKGHVTLGSLRVRQDYLIALGLTSPFNSENTDTTPMKEMALARIRQLSAHEVGHTLGIAHNFAASVNNRASVMDYPHPLVMLKDGEIDLSQAYDNKIGEWDKFVIAYGYGDYDQAQEASALTALIEQAQAKGLQYISDPDARPRSGGHATAHLWDNGASAVDELNRMMKVREHALNHLGINSIANGTPLSEIEQVLVPIYNFHRFQVEAAVKLVAGVHYHYEVKGEQQVKGVSQVDGENQLAAVNALLATLDAQTLTLPESLIKLIPPKAYGYSRNRESFTSNTGLTFDPVTAAQANAKHTISLLLEQGRLARLAQHHMFDSSVPSIDKLFSMLLAQTLKQKPDTGLSVLVQQRINQEVVEQLLTLWHSPTTVIEVKAHVYQTLNSLVKWLDDKQGDRKYKAMSAQFTLLSMMIKSSLENNTRIQEANSLRLPPGSPIGQ
ncbi:zinc-dependent metalloprotease [Thalassotalea sp. LPB0316]|uniref:zinc-dependent metalloprotease n=1 Tax=Thalassotalea sp. LPB0316 TaxID=2769490 RepID=UPI001865C69C|nr:zinc-dependent metalloprotease [Thalassotalea sp. LPB0316]QOL26668.1 zinc-dependent metalloprotease [Thalassotalea sp. LPB0316]